MCQLCDFIQVQIELKAVTAGSVFLIALLYIFKAGNAARTK